MFKRRFRAKKKFDKKYFSKTAAITKSKNYSGAMRGGIRL